MPLQIDGVEQQRPHVEILAARLVRDPLGKRALGAARSAPQDRGLAGFHEQGQGVGKLARAERVVGGNGVWVVGHRRPPDQRDDGAEASLGPRAFAFAGAGRFAHRVGRQGVGVGSRVAVRRRSWGQVRIRPVRSLCPAVAGETPVRSGRGAPEGERV